MNERHTVSRRTVLQGGAALGTGVLAHSFALPVANAVPGPDPATWIPGGGTVQTIGSVTVRLQNGPYNANGVYKIFVQAVSGKDLRLRVNGAAGEKVDHFDERRDNGLYGIFGSVDQGSAIIDVEAAPSGTNDWSSQGTKSIAIAPPGQLLYDTEVPTNVWYISDLYNAGTITQTQLSNQLDQDFGDLTSRGFTSITYQWNPVKYLSTIFSKLSQYDLKIQLAMQRANGFARSLADLGHHNVPLLEMESKLIQDGINTDVGGGVRVKDHPMLWSYYLVDEPNVGDHIEVAVELEAMLVKALDPGHAGNASLAYLHEASTAWQITRTPFVGAIVSESYPLASARSPSDFSKNMPFPNSLGPISVPDHLDWVRRWDQRRPVENIVQAHSGAGFYRDPSPTEMRALIMMSAARGSRPLTYFIYQSFGNVVGMTDTNRTVTPKLEAATAINAKLTSWRPTYQQLTVDGDDAYVAYPQQPGASGVAYSNDFESASKVLGVSEIATSRAHSGTHSGLRPATLGNNVSRLVVHHGIDELPRYDSFTYRVWVNDLGNAGMIYRIGVQFIKGDGTFPQHWTGPTSIGSGWQELVLDLTAQAIDPEYLMIEQIFFRALTSGNYVDHYLDDIRLEYTTPAHTPKYDLYGGVVGSFTHANTSDRHLIVVNTDTENTKTVTVNKVRNSDGNLATAATDVVDGTAYALENGTLNIGLDPGDGALLRVDSGITVLYSNDMESSLTYGGTLSTNHSHGSAQSELLPANGDTHWPIVSRPLPTTPVDRFMYSTWVYDGGNPDQIYRLGVRFEKPDHTLDQVTETNWFAVGSGWTQIIGDFTDLVNTRISQGYTKLFQIGLRAFTPKTYVPYYTDDVIVTYQ